MADDDRQGTAGQGAARQGAAEDGAAEDGAAQGDAARPGAAGEGAAQEGGAQPRPQAAPYYLAALDLRGRRCLVAGGGAVAHRKTEGLLAAGADVLVVAPDLGEMPRGAAVERRAVRLADLDGAVLAVCATDDPAVNAALAREARRRGVLVNVVDDPDAGDFTVPAVLRRGTLQVGVSTGGASPALAQRLRDELATRVGDEYGRLADLLAALREAWEPRAIAAGVPPAARRAAWHAVQDLPLLGLIRDGRADEARAQAQATLERVLETRRSDAR
jgi:siroheme synthase-like protein